MREEKRGSTVNIPKLKAERNVHDGGDEKGRGHDHKVDGRDPKRLENEE